MDRSGGDLVGCSLGGRYDVLELLGAGGMGAVYRVLDRELDEVVALKVILGELAGNPHAIELFRNEVRLARRVTHPNVARTFELGHANGVVYCTMELVEGETLRDRLRQRGRLPIDEAAQIASTLCDALTAAHDAGVIHRDVKPDNVWIDPRGRVVLGDFGVATANIAREGGAAGTPAYMAPEQAGGASPSPSVDVYSVGILLHEMVTGEIAFSGTMFEIYEAKLAREHVDTPGAPAELAAVIRRATARELAHRFSTARALRDALAPWARGEVASTHDDRASAVDVRTVLVRPPVAPPETLHLVQAVYAALLQRLARLPRVSLYTRRSREQPAAVVELTAGRDLAIVVTAANEALALRVPLSVAHVAVAASAASEAVVAALAAAPATYEVRELVMRARALASSGVARSGNAVEVLEHAAILAPDDPKIAAELACAKIQRAFFSNLDDRPLLDRATQLVQLSLQAAPDALETHLAAGMLELHTGGSERAAARFRLAIAAAPNDPAAHEQLGRMLLEAGHIGPGLERLDEAIARSPLQRSVRWEIARVRALEQRWDEHDHLVDELAALGQHDLLGELRFTCWRGNVERVRKLRERFQRERVFEPVLFDGMFASLCDGAWPQYKDELVALALQCPRASSRRRAIVAQFVAEIAGIAGDVGTCERVLAHAVEQDLFDLHWLDRCPVLATVRSGSAFRKVRGRVAGRANAILDALYGDHELRSATATVYIR